MKLQVTQENFNRALNAVARVADNHGTLPVLANVLIKAKNNRFSVAATNLNVAITYFVGAKIETEGVITVPANLLASFVNSLPSGIIQLDVEDKKLKITTNQYKSTINGISADEFPVMPAIENGQNFMVNGGELKKALQQVVFTASTSDSRPTLSGVLFKAENNKLYIVATDSSRLAEKTLTAKVSDFELLVPASSINDLLRVLDDDVKSLKIIKDDQQALFSFKDVELVSRLIDGDYPNYKPLIPIKSATKATLKKNDLLNIVKVSSLFARETGGSITIEVNENDKAVKIKSLASQIGENNAQASAKVTGSGSITLNSKFLIDGLNAFEGEEITFAFNSKLEPIVLRDPKDPNYVHVIMPLKV